MRILIVDHDRTSAMALEAGLQKEGFLVTLTGTGEEGLYLLGTDNFDLVLLDWMLPGRDGLEILKAARARGTKTPIVLLTARDAIADRVLGLESGADDCLVKPFAFAELVARVRASLRRAPIRQSLHGRIADLSVDFETRIVARGGQRIDLTPREFKVLACLMRHPGEVVTRQMILRDILSETHRQAPLDNVIDVHVTNLRRKVDGGRPTTLIQTVRGVGFILREERRSET